MQVLSAIENTGFAVWVRESGSVWSYPTIIFLHSLGLSFVVGMNAMLDLRLLGFAPRLPIPAMEKLFPVMWAGFGINAVSGVALTMADAATWFVSWVFYLKMAFIAAAMVNMLLIKRRVFRDARLNVAPAPANSKLLAAASLFFWTGAITAGRLTAYLGPVVANSGR